MAATFGAAFFAAAAAFFGASFLAFATAFAAFSARAAVTGAFFAFIFSIAFSATGASSCPSAGASTSTTSDQRMS